MPDAPKRPQDPSPPWAPSSPVLCRDRLSRPRLPTSHHGLRGEEGLGEAIEVAQVELDAGVGDSQFMDVSGAVLGTDVALTREWGHSDGIFKLIEWQVV